MSFLDKLEKQDDKWNVADLIRVQEKLPERVTEPIPACIFRNFEKTDDGTIKPSELDYEVFNILAWGIARRENPDITLEEVAERIGVSNLAEVTQDIWYFYTARTRESMEERLEEMSSEEDSGEEVAENPPPDSPSSDS